MKTVKKVEHTPFIQPRKRVAAYARVSCDKQTMLQSMSAQISYYNSLIQRHPEWEFAGIYADDPISGTKDRRAEFMCLVEDCREGKIDMIFTKSISRFARNTLTTLATVRELKELGIDVFFEKENIHSLSEDGELLLTVLASYAQEESRSVSENCKWRIRKKFEEGRPNTGNMLGYRLVEGKLHIVPDEAEIVRQIFADYLAGFGRQAIAKKLYITGFATLRGGRWSINSIRRILTNEKYTGTMLLQKTYVQDHISKKRVDNHGELPMYKVEQSHEAIISKSDFDAVQAEIARRAALHAPSSTEKTISVFTSKIVCEKCGHNFHLRHTAIGTKYDKLAWMCSTFDKLGKSVCDAQQIPDYILRAKCAEILGLSDFDEQVFRAQIAEIRVPAHNTLVFVFKSGPRVEAHWQNPSRCESWTPEMKQAARERQEKINLERRKSSE
ncbi:MAG: recombinase family protein [Oscillospiraceae bacterium]|nr:recombinase family protein [Oscillospiraceae bacterium]